MRPLPLLLKALLIGSLIAIPTAKAKRVAKKPHSHVLIQTSLMQRVQTTINRIPRSPIVRLINRPQNVLCTALAIYREARGISETEQALVAKTIIHREASDNENACQVIAQKGQFPWVKSLSKNWHPTELNAWVKAQKIAILSRYTNLYPEPSCYIRFFSVGLYLKHRRNLSCVIHMPGHYYYQMP